MRRRLFLVTSVVLCVLVSISLIWQARFSRAQIEEGAATPCCDQSAAIAPRQLEFPYYTLRDGFNSSLLLVSDSPKPLEFVVALHSRSGQTVLAPTMIIQPQEKLTVDLRALLTSLSADVMGDFAEGSVSIYFNGTIMPLGGQLTMSNPARSLVLESEMVDNSPGLGLLPSVLNAVWWGLGGGREARFTVSNTSGDPVTADVFLDFQGERHPSAPLVFAPHETQVLSVADLLADLKVSPVQVPEGGITVVPRGAKPALIAQGKITDPARGFSTSLNFLDPSLQRANALHASGVPIGLPSKESPYAGAGVFVPHVVVRNLTGAPQSVTITVEYPGEKGPQQSVLAPLALGPYSTQDISLDSAVGLLPLPLPYCSIRIQYSGPPGTVIGEVSSIESKGDLVIDSRLANEGDGWAHSGGHPWHLDEETESVLFLTNMSERTARIGFQVQAGGVHYYLTDLKLRPRETRAIDIRELRDAQKEDFQKNKIPASATDGSVLWGGIDNVPVMGRLVVLQRRRRMASNYDCTYCPCDWSYVGLRIIPGSSDIRLPGGTASLVAQGLYQDCNGPIYPWNVPANWSSRNTEIATVTGGVVTGKSPGEVRIDAVFQDWQYLWLQGYCWPSFPQRTAYHMANVNYGCKDQRDLVIHEYYLYPTSTINPYYPTCSAFTNNASTPHFSFAELDKNQWYSWAILRQVFLTGLENTRVAYNQAMTVNSGYRSPKYNATQILDPAPGSRHVFGDAADIASDENTWHDLHDRAKENAACVEPHETQGNYNHVHMDWRGTCPTGW